MLSNTNTDKSMISLRASKAQAVTTVAQYQAATPREQVQLRKKHALEMQKKAQAKNKAVGDSRNSMAALQAMASANKALTITAAWTAVQTDALAAKVKYDVEACGTSIVRRASSPAIS